MRRAARSLAGAAPCALLVLSLPASAQNWARATGIDTSRGTISLERHDGVFYATSDTLVYRSADGAAWQPTAAQPAPGALTYGTLQAHATGLYIGTNSHGVFRTVNGGQTWTPAGTNLPGEDVLDLAVLGDSLYAGLGFSGVHVLNLASPGAWAPYTTGLTQFGANSLNAVGDRLFAGLGNGFFVRARGAAQWTEIDLGGQRQVYDVVGREGALYAATTNGVYKAPAPDSAWRPADIGGMNGRDIYALAFHGARLYAGLNYRFEHWIWSTDNGGASWDVRAHEFTEVWDLRVQENRLYAARSDGLWYLDLAPASIGGRRPVSARPTGGSARAWRPDGRRVRAGGRAIEITLPSSP